MKQASVAARLLLVSAVTVAGEACASPPTDSEIRLAFLKEHPTAIVTNVSTIYPNVEAGKTGGDIVHKHIRFATSSSAVECEVVWGYSDAEPQWIRFYKSQPALPGTLCMGCAMKPCASANAAGL